MATSKFHIGQQVIRTGRGRCGVKQGATYTVREVVCPGAASEGLVLEGMMDHLYGSKAFAPAVAESEPVTGPLMSPEPSVPPHRFGSGSHVECINNTSILKKGWVYVVEGTVTRGNPATNYVTLVGIPGDFVEDRFVLVFDPTAPDIESLPPAAPDLKPTNPKDAIGNRKLQLGLLPFAFQAQTALALTDGKYKYGAHNWTIGGVRASIYIDAALRHIGRFNAGQLRDPDSNIHNLGHAAACIAILLDAEARGVLNDDRPPAMNPDVLLGLQNTYNTLTGRLIDDHVAAGRAPKHWTIEDSEGSGDAD